MSIVLRSQRGRDQLQSLQLLPMTMRLVSCAQTSPKIRFLEKCINLIALYILIFSEGQNCKGTKITVNERIDKGFKSILAAIL